MARLVEAAGRVANESVFIILERNRVDKEVDGLATYNAVSNTPEMPCQNQVFIRTICLAWNHVEDVIQHGSRAQRNGLGEHVHSIRAGSPQLSFVQF